MIKMCKYMYLHLLVIHFCHFVIVRIQTHFWPLSSEQKLWKRSYGIIKKTREKRSNKTKRSDIKYVLTIYFLTETTQKCANIIHVLLVFHFIIFFLVFKICIFQWLNCRNPKYELNRSYNCGGVVYVLKRELSISTIKYCSDENSDHIFRGIASPPPFYERFFSYFRSLKFSHWYLNS